MPKKFTSAMANAAPTTPGPTMVGMIFRSGTRKAATPLMTKPTSGSSAIAQSKVGSNACSSTTSPFQQIEALHIDRFRVTEDRYYDRQADRGFRGGHGHHEEHEDLPFDPDHA